MSRDKVFPDLLPKDREPVLYEKSTESTTNRSIHLHFNSKSKAKSYQRSRSAIQKARCGEKGRNRQKKNEKRNSREKEKRRTEPLQERKLRLAKRKSKENSS